jgi:hypothetical protein
MAKNEVPVFTRSPVIGWVQIAIANPNINGTGTILTVLNGGVDGNRLDQIEVKAEGVTRAGMIRLYISFDTGTTWSLWREIAVTAITPSATVKAFRAVIDLTVAQDDLPLSLPDDQTWLGVSTEFGAPDSFQVFARGGSFSA